jgi:hypothetical protein
MFYASIHSSGVDLIAVTFDLFMFFQTKIEATVEIMNKTQNSKVLYYLISSSYDALP